MFVSEKDVFNKNRECILIGVLEECERFYCSFHNFFNIKYIVLYNESNVRLDCAKKLYVEYSEIENELNEYYIILCQKTDIANSPWDDIFYRKGICYKDDYIDSAYLLMWVRNRREDILKTKEIWIFGAGNNGEYFWNAYNKEYKICGFVSNYENQKEKCGLPVVRLQQLQNRGNVFIVICSIYEMDMYDQLLDIGMKEEYDFTFSNFFQKKLFVGVGTCQVSYSVGMLLLNKNFDNRFVCMRVGENLANYAPMVNRIRMKLYSKFCNVLFYQIPDLKGAVSLDYSSIYKNYDKALKIKMPFYYFQGIHMQMDVILPTNKKYTIMNAEGLFSSVALYCYRMDKEILKMVSDDMNSQEISSKILSENYLPKEKILQKFRTSVNVLKYFDKSSDIKITPFLLKHYKDIPVFTDTEHFGPELLVYVANELAKILDIEVIDKENAESFEEDFKKFWAYNLYIYPSVAKTLELDYWQYDMKYQNTPYAHGQKLSLEEYVMRQITFVKRVNEFWTWLGDDKNELL